MKEFMERADAMARKIWEENPGEPGVLMAACVAVCSHILSHMALNDRHLEGGIENVNNDIKKLAEMNYARIRKEGIRQH